MGGAGGAGGAAGTSAVGVGGSGGSGDRCPSVGNGSRVGDPNATSRWSRTFVISDWLGPGQWSGLASTAAVDKDDRLYFTDGSQIYIADGAGARVLYSQAILSADFDADATEYGVGNLSLSPDGRLFAFVNLSSARFTTAVYAADGQGHLRLFADFKSFWPNYPVIAAVTSDYVLAPFDSLYCVTSSQVTPIYGPSTTIYWDAYGCANRAIAAEASGVFYYTSGCNGSSLFAGQTDGSGVAKLAALTDLSTDFYANFLAIAAAPHGGSIANLGKDFFYVDAAKTHIRLDMTPSTSGAYEQYCAAAVASTDTIYIVCYTGHIYRAVPQP